MYSSLDNCTHNPLSFSGQNIPHRPLYNSEINTNSSTFEDARPASLFHFPSPYSQYEDAVIDLTWQQLHDLFILHQPVTAENNSTIAEIVNHMKDPSKDHTDGLKQDWNIKCESMAEKITKKRSSKKDRHSKINTAQGPRDRRMRLSLDVARKFFDLQDILGFDKASKTVEWLLIQSSSAINEIMRGLPRMRHSRSVGANTSVSSTTSECEAVSSMLSGIEDTTKDNQQTSMSTKMKVKLSCKKEKKAKLARRTALSRLAKESRKVARERARKRTIEKKRLGESKICLGSRNSDENRLGSWSTHFETVEESGTQGGKIMPSKEGLTQVEELNSQERRLLESAEYIDGDILVITGNWNPSSICNYQPTSEISHEQQFTDFQFYGKTWEAHNNMNLVG